MILDLDEEVVINSKDQISKIIIIDNFKRVVGKIRQQIMEAEDREILKSLDNA